MTWMYALILPEIIVGVLIVLGIIFSAIGEEMAGPVGKFFARFRWTYDSGQSVYVRRAISGLASSRITQRMRAIRLLGEMRDSSAVPVLLRAGERFRSEPKLLAEIVTALEPVADRRALPLLRNLSSGKNASLMLAARTLASRIQEGNSKH